MRVIRRRLSCLVALWLVMQAAGLGAAPVLAALGQADDACCPGIGPGQTCPMHHSRESDRTCKMRSGCPRVETALLSMAGGPGVLPGATDVVTAFDLGDRVSPMSPSARSRAARPESPPPRA